MFEIGYLLTLTAFSLVILFGDALQEEEIIIGYDG
jgi:hypothetical protein